jgi:hypothetical protein
MIPGSPSGPVRVAECFSAISDSITRMLASKRFNCVNYIDEFHVVADDLVTCCAGLDCLVSLVQSLGLENNWEKGVGPHTALTFRGVHIDCVARVLSLPASKLS